MNMRRGRPSDEDVLLGLVPPAGELVGNVSLLRQLEQRGWSEDKFWRIRDHLLDEGVLLRGRGKGGSVRRVVAEPSEAPVSSPVKVQPKTSSELSLYDPLLKVLRADWIREMRIEQDQIHFEITASQGRKATGGTWTRPDISAVSVRTFQHLPNKYLDVWTFEVKTLESLDITAIFETAAHASRATRSYALLQIPGEPSARDVEVLERCDREADRLRVGLITFTSTSDFATWETRVEAPRVDTDPEALEEFISQLSEEAKRRLARWK